MKTLEKRETETDSVREIDTERDRDREHQKHRHRERQRQREIQRETETESLFQFVSNTCQKIYVFIDCRLMAPSTAHGNLRVFQ